jgi:hypothetical protein
MQLSNFIGMGVSTPKSNPFFDGIRALIGQDGLNKYYDWVVKEAGGKENFSFASTSDYWGADSLYFKKYLNEVKDGNREKNL